ncbi:cache domain-containing sensor histidine kinase [Lacrimispora sp.]|uniref:cache domain-containing sensor histidine kinase n=1 Tax=Lacrimispora sp. TaxID=2719234 RepID=UPI002FD9113F
MKRRFFLKNFAMMTVPTLLAVLLIGLLSMFLVYDNAKKAVNSANERALSALRESMELILSEADAQSLNYSVSPHVMLRLEDLLENGYIGKEQMDTAYMFKSFVDSSVNCKPFVHSLYIYLENEKGYFFASTVGLANSFNHYDTEWMERTGQMPITRRQWIEPREIRQNDSGRYKTPVVSVYKRLYASDKNAPIGVLVLNIREDYLNSLCRESVAYEQQSILLMNEQGEVLCQGGAAVDMEQPLQKDAFFLSDTNQASGITCVSAIPNSIVWEQAQPVAILVGQVMAAAFAMGIIAAYFATRRNARAVGAIVNLVDSAEHGDPLPDVKQDSDIYGYITQGIVRGFLERNALDKQLAEKRYRLEAMYFSFLQSQLNPHFLFNTLKNIFWKTVKLTGGANDASHMIDLLTSVLYYTLVNREQYVKIEEECTHTSKYIEIQSLRFDNAFCVEWNVEKELRECRCIKFLLQPILENSISHGLRNKEDGLIRISISSSRERIFFSVWDSGTGFTAERLSEIRTQLESEDMPEESIGLYNLNKRLQLAYDSEASLSIESVPGVETVVRFSIPIRE